MGICCCRAESPCSSAEERSGLLSDDGKAAGPAGEKHGGGTCGPDGDDCKRKTSGDTSIKVEVKTETVQVKQSLEAEPNNTQENGPLLKGDIQTSTPSPKRESELQENSTRAQHVDMKDCHADSHQADLLTCTLDTAQEVHAAAEWQGPGEQENPASVQDKTLVDGSVMTNEVYPEILTQADATAEHISSSAAHDNSEEEEEAGAKVDSAVDEQSQQQTNEAPSGAAHQPALVPAVGQEVDKEALSCDVTTDLHCGSSSVVKEAEPEVVNSPDVSKITSGSEPLELNHSGEETGSEKHAPEPETTARTDPSESSTSNQDENPAVEFADTSSTEVASLEVIKQDVTEEEAPEGQDEDEDAPTAEEEEDAEKKQEVVSVPMEGGDGERKESVDEEKLTGSSPADVEGDEPRATEKKDAAENDLGNSEEDLYRGADELSAPPDNDPGSPSEPTFLKVEDRCSLAPAMDILSYSEREWKGNTAKSALIRKGYKDMSQRFGSLRRVRGDNYCALRATLFQVLTHSTQLPPWLQEQDVTMLPSRLEAQEGLISQWTFPGECLQAEGTGDATLQLQGYMELLQNKWQAAVDCASAGERLQLCERLFGGGEEELALLEALKLLMLGRAAELHGRMQKSEDVPFFCWLLFARDTSDSLRSFLCNHLSHVGLSAGLEQVEMFLLGYALRCTIQVYRLYKADTEEFVTYYPDDHKDDWPSVCLVTEDDRHYNVPVEHAAEAQELDSS